MRFEEVLKILFFAAIFFAMRLMCVLQREKDQFILWALD
jgi:hypothetical protein